MPNPETPNLPPNPPAPGTPPDKRHPWLWVVVILVIAGIAALTYFRHAKPKTPAPPPLTISTTNAQSGDIDVTVTRIGTVTPYYVAALSPRVDGQVIAAPFSEGQLVQSNDLLIEIDPRPFEALKTQAEGQLARDQAMLDAARIDEQRYQAAYEKKAIPQQQLADQQALVRQDEGTVLFDKGQVTNAVVQLDYCFIRAPFNGRVGLRPVDPGNVVHAASSNAVAVVAQLQPITVIFSPPEDELSEILRQLKAGNTMTVEAYDRTAEKKLATGKLLTVDNLIDTTTGTIRIKAIFQNEDLKLFPNQFVNAKLIIETLHRQTLVPTPAIQRNPQGAFVYVLTNSPAGAAVTMRNVTVGVSDIDVSSVEGLEPGETIATDNFNRMGEGTRVTVRDQGGQKAPGDATKHRHKMVSNSDS